MAAVAEIDIGPRDRLAGQSLDLVELRPQRVTVIWITRTGACPEHERAARRTGIGHREAELDAELPADACLALADAFDLGRVQRVELAFVVLLLRQQASDARHHLAAHLAQ